MKLCAIEKHLLLFSGVIIDYYYYVQVSQYVCVFAALDREIPWAEHCQFSKLSRLKQFSCDLGVGQKSCLLQGVAAALGFNRQVFQRLIEVALCTS